MKLTDLNRGETAVVGSLAVDSLKSASQKQSLRRLLDLGLTPNCPLKVLHKAPFGGDPIAIEFRGTVVALRRSEAEHIEILKSPINTSISSSCL